ncbi:hypothetical protein D3C79_1116030 [compost metagenome]
MGTQKTVNLDHVVIFVKYKDAMSDRIHHILMGYGRYIKHFIAVNGNHKKDGRQ